MAARVSSFVFLIAPFSCNPQHPWFSPGRHHKLQQLNDILTRLSLPLYKLNTCPDPSANSLCQLFQLCSSSIAPVRLLQLVAATITLSRSTIFRLNVDTLWVYNQRFSEALVALILFLSKPSIELILQIEDLPGARIQNSGLRGYIDYLCLLALSSIAHRIFVVSPNVEITLRSLVPFSLPPIIFFPPYLSPQYQQTISTRRPPFQSEIITILYAGGYSTEKGISELIAAFLSLDSSRYRLLLAGNIPNSLRKELVVHSNIQPLGYLSFPQLYDLYSQSDVLVNPHHVTTTSSYIFPFKLVEYVSSGSLVFTTRMPGAELLGLPEDCFFDTTPELLTKLNDSRIIWTSCREQILLSSSQLFLNYSFDSALAPFRECFKRF